MLDPFDHVCMEFDRMKFLKDKRCVTCSKCGTDKCKDEIFLIGPHETYCSSYVNKLEECKMKEHNRRRYFFNSTTRDLIAKMYRINGPRVPNEELLIEEMGELQQAWIKKSRSRFEAHLDPEVTEENYEEELCDVMGLCYSILANYHGLSDEEITKHIYEKHHRAYNRYLAQKSQGL